MKKLFLLIMFFCCNFKTIAQDKVLFTDSSVVEVNITEISDTHVSYKMVINPDGPLYVIPEYQIARVTFKNGTIKEYRPASGKPIVEKLDKINSTVLEPPSTKKNFFRYYFTDIFAYKLSFGYERLLNSKYSFEFDCFYKFPAHLDAIYSGHLSSGFLESFQGGELRSGLSKHFTLKKRTLSVGFCLSYREQTFANKYYFLNYPEDGAYLFSQTKRGIGLFNKTNIQFKPRRSGIEFFVLIGGYLCFTKNKYIQYWPSNSSRNVISDPSLIPPIKNYYLRSGFAALPYINFGFDLKIKQPEDGRRAQRIEERKKSQFSRKNIILYDIFTLADGNVGGTYMRIIYPRALSLSGSVSFNTNKNNSCTFSNGTLIEQNRNYYLSRRLFDVNTGVNHNFSIDQQSFGFVGIMSRLARFEGTCYSHDFTLDKYYAGLNLGALARSDKGLSFLTSLQFGYYFNNYTKGNANPYMNQYGANICDIGVFFNLSFQFGYSF